MFCLRASFLTYTCSLTPTIRLNTITPETRNARNLKSTLILKPQSRADDFQRTEKRLYFEGLGSWLICKHKKALTLWQTSAQTRMSLPLGPWLTGYCTENPANRQDNFPRRTAPEPISSWWIVTMSKKLWTKVVLSPHAAFLLVLMIRPEADNSAECSSRRLGRQHNPKEIFQTAGELFWWELCGLCHCQGQRFWNFHLNYISHQPPWIRV